MEQKSKRIMRVAAIVLLCFVCSNRACRYQFERGRSNSNQAGIARYEAISIDAEAVTGDAEKGIGRSLESMHTARREIAESVTGIGAIRDGVGTIEGELENSAAAINRIEDGISVIERILQEAENRTDYLANSSEP